MATQLTQTVTVRDGEARFDGFVESDRAVVRLLERSEVVDDAARRCLQTGARALTAAGTSIDTAAVGDAFDRMVARLNADIERLAGRIDAAVAPEGGEIAESLRAADVALGNTLGRVFDEDSRSSVMGRFGDALEAHRQAQAAALRGVLDASDPGSPLGRHRAEMLTALRTESDRTRNAITSLAQEVAVARSGRQAMERTAVKGQEFEQWLYEIVTQLVTPGRDVAERVGSAVGTMGGKVGDIVVTVDPEDTAGQHGAYVIEAKDRRVGLRDALTQLKEGQENRDSAAAIVVFSREEYSPAGSPFAVHGNCALVVLDKDRPEEDSALRLGLLWARWTVRRSLDAVRDGVSADVVLQAVSDATRALERVSTIRRAHSSALKRIDEAGSHCDGMVDDVHRALETLR